MGERRPLASSSSPFFLYRSARRCHPERARGTRAKRRICCSSTSQRRSSAITALRSRSFAS